MARSAPAPALNVTRFLRDLVVVLLGTGLVVAAVIRWIAVPWSVEGRSMAPTLEAGDRVLVDLTEYRGRVPRIGEIVLLDGPGEVALVKRVAVPPAPAIPAPRGELAATDPLESTVWVLGDNPAESGDSRLFGPVPCHRIRGRVVWRYWPPSRLGPIE